MKLVAPIDELLRELGRAACRVLLGLSQYLLYRFNHALERSSSRVLGRDIRADSVSKGNAVGRRLVRFVGDDCAELSEQLAVFFPEMFNHWHALKK
jgi:hypothetical protein